jgi:hypothetical protein
MLETFRVQGRSGARHRIALNCLNLFTRRLAMSIGDFSDFASASERYRKRISNGLAAAE